MTDTAAVTTPPAAPAPSPAPPRSLVGRVLDAVLDTAVVSFAVWTLLYTLGLPTQWSLWPSGWIWLVVTLVVLGHELWRALRGDDALPEPAASGPVALVGERRERLLLLVGLALVAAAGLGGLVWTEATFWPTWLALAAGLLVLLAWAWLSGQARWVDDAASPTGPAAAPPAGPAAGGTRRLVTPSEAGALVLALLAAVAASFTHLVDTDDPYYVNRSVWVAEHGNAALDDTMFSPEVFNSPYGGGVPISSVEGLFGVIAHMTGLLAGTVTWVVVPPVAAFLAVLAMWRLVVRWAPRRHLLVLLGAVAFLMLSGDSMLGNFWVPRIWQGKVIAVVVLMPLIWAYLTELLEARAPRSRVRHLVLLLLAGVAFYGLTPTAVVWAPVMFGAVLLAAIMLRSRLLALGGVAMLVGPLLSGLAVVAFSTEVGGPEPQTLSARESFVRILGEQTPMVALALVALGAAVVAARRGTAAALAGTASAAAVLVFAPGVLPVLNTVTGSGPILWRMLMVAPIPVLVGLLLAVAPPRLGAGRERVAAAVAAAPVAVVVAGLALGGLPVWSHTGHNGPVQVTDRPTWKVDRAALRDVEALVDDLPGDPPSGPVLLPPLRMKVLTTYTTEVFPVVPREWFVQNIEEPRADRRARFLLHDLARGEMRKFPGPRTTRKALERLDVSLACVGGGENGERVLKLYRSAGYTDAVSYGSLRCLRP